MCILFLRWCTDPVAMCSKQCYCNIGLKVHTYKPKTNRKQVSRKTVKSPFKYEHQWWQCIYSEISSFFCHWIFKGIISGESWSQSQKHFLLFSFHHLFHASRNHLHLPPYTSAGIHLSSHCPILHTCPSFVIPFFLCH